MARLHEAIQVAADYTGWVAFRPTGLVLVVGRHGAVSSIKPGKALHWQPNLRDLTAQDWRCGLFEDALKQLVAEGAITLPESGATGEGGAAAADADQAGDRGGQSNQS